MALTLGDNFSYQGAKPLDGRLKYDTLAAMKAVADATMYDGCLAYCLATDKTYQWKSSNTVDTNTGRWREFSSGGSGVTNYNDLENRPQIEGVTLTGNKTASDLGLAKANQIPTVPTKVSQLQNDSGFITNSDLPGVYEGSTAGLVPSAGSDNEGKYLDNDGNWTTVPMPMIGTINRSDIYDTTEKVIGKWTDGKPIYQKTFTGTTPSVANSNNELFIVNFAEGADSWTIDIGASVDTVIKFDGFVTLASGRCYQLREGTAAKGWFTGWTTNNSHSTKPNIITLSTGSLSTLLSRPYVVTLTYTKTTDAANSYNYADENDYSTSEKIIGKWIDGKTLYQKTILANPLTQASGSSIWQSNTPHNISNLDKIIDIDTFSPSGLKATFVGIKAQDGTLSGYLNSYIESSTQEIVIKSTSDRSSMVFYTTLKYTKTS